MPKSNEMNSAIIVLSIITILFFIMPKKANLKGKDNSGDMPDNLGAFLRTIQYAEGTFGQPNPYAVVFGFGHIIKNFIDHPAITGEWKGKRLSDALCRGAGFGPECKSTAAGAYQFIKPTWLNIKKSIPSLKFDKDGQEEAAIFLIERKGALDDILNGAFEEAIFKCNKIWASLPGSPYGQRTRSIESLKDFYLDQGGNLLEV